jgi:hypothetical protein
MNKDLIAKPSSREEKAKLTAWLSTQRGRPQYRHAPAASRAVRKIVKPLSRKFGAGVNAISENWQEIAGPRFAKFSRPVKITGGRDGRTLYIQAPGAAAALIMASSGQIIDRLNTFLGYGHISRIKVIQGPANPNAKSSLPANSAPRGLTPSEDRSLHSALSSVKDPALKEALEKLGRKALTRDDKGSG